MTGTERSGRKPGPWLQLLDAALDQPNPSAALKAALDALLSRDQPRRPPVTGQEGTKYFLEREREYRGP